MLSVARDRPVDPLAIEILSQIDPVARALGIEYLVAGATARDILLVGVFGLETGRATRDVDLAVAGAAGNEDRLYGAESAVLEASGYDVDLAGPRLLGRDVARISRAETKRMLRALLDDGPNLERLARAMVREMGAAPDPVARARDLIGRFRTGLREG